MGVKADILNERSKLDNAMIVGSEIREVIAELEGENEGLRKKVREEICGDCLPGAYGWNENRVEGRIPCSCISESEAYQELEAKNEKLLKALKKIKAIKVDDEMHPSQQRGWMYHAAHEALKETGHE